MAGGNFEEGIARARSKETNNQKDSGATSAKWSKHIKLGRETKSNPKKGGGINRALKSN